MRPLPDRIDPIRFADHARSVEGVVAVRKLPRLQQLFQAADGEVNVALEFGRDEGGCRFIRGQFEVVLPCICERCNQPMELTHTVLLSLSPLVSDGQASSLPKEYAPIITGGEPISLYEMLEDEILLNLPIAIKHNDQTCASKTK